MTREALKFQAALLISLGIHAVLFVLIVTFAGGRSGEPVAVYTVRILEVPSRPQARELSLSTEAISALKLESPSLRTDAPPTPEVDSAAIPERERFPPVLPTPETENPPTPDAPEVKQIAEPDAVRLPAPTEPSVSPRLPGLPTPDIAKVEPPGGTPRVSPPTPATPPTPRTPDIEEPDRPSLKERTREVLRRRKLSLDEEPAVPDLNRPNTPDTERNLLALRVYRNRVHEAVLEQFKFPGDFPQHLQTRVRVELARDGAIRKTQVLESSGDTRFNLVCMRAIQKAKIPPIPRELEEDTLTLHFTCSP